MVKEQKTNQTKENAKILWPKKNNLLRNILIPPRIFGEQ